MVRSRLNDIKIAKEIAIQLKYKLSAPLIQQMEKKVMNKEKIDWSETQKFLDEFEIDTTNNSEIAKSTFDIMENVLLKAMDDAGNRSLKELENLAKSAPPIDRYIEILDGSLSIIHNEINTTRKKEVMVILLMFGHVIRWQALEDFAKSWVYHYGKGLSNDGLKKEAIEALIGIKLYTKTSTTIMADSRLYRNAIAHGGFKLTNLDMIDFWTRDERGVKHDLIPLNSGDIAGLYQFSEIRLRTMEIFARVLRAWGRHHS